MSDSIRAGGWTPPPLNTWLRQRHDLKDQSQSGYDMALAVFGAQSGLTEQQIVDLIVHHRSSTHPDWCHMVEYPHSENA